MLIIPTILLVVGRVLADDLVIRDRLQRVPVGREWAEKTEGFHRGDTS
jgi:hypothetical protein